MYIPSLNALRFLAAIIVVVFHYGQAHVPSGFLTAGPEMVTFFVVLSGFSLALGYGDRPVDLREFMLRRAVRILPLHWLALACSVVISLLLYPPFPLLPLVAHLLLVQSWLPSISLLFNAPAWAISVLFSFYLMFPLLWYVMRRLPLPLILAAAFGLWLTTQVLWVVLFQRFYSDDPATHSLFYYWPPLHLCSFLMGIAGGRLLHARRYVTSMPAMLGVIALTVLVLENKLRIVGWAGVPLPFAGSLPAPLFLWLILAVATADNLVTRGMSGRTFAVLGQASFAIYLLQMPLRTLYERLPHPSGLADIVVFLVLLTGIAVLVQRYVEAPAVAWMQKWCGAIRGGS